ncbi:MAG: DNA polymerase III subunit gamma/tau [Lachnospiraceae bacterium]|nr:DNA polymerase III subunit gamma/tau [Lachnospiraceae bacterium]
MAYTALYRKFRPQGFPDVRGQEHIVTTLRNQLLLNRIGHAYLFTGTRGTGKTTVAKILARAVNCENLSDDGSPCGECEMCRAIAAGNSLNVAEIDAASNNSVENVRQIIEEVSYPPSNGKYKVYILDEAHMLTPAACNALLKTLEEPPHYVIFILATTDPGRLPITILSRCQRYDFKRIPIETIAGRMKELVAAEGIDVEEKALQYVAKAADGSMRDGLSLLDQCVAFHFGETLTYDKVLEILGAVDTEVFSRLVRAVMAEDVSSAMRIVEEVVMQGREISQFTADFIWYLRNIMLLKASDGGDMEELLNVSSDHLARLKEEAQKLEMNTILRYIRVFSELQQNMRYATQKRIMLETWLIRLMRPQMDTDPESLLERLRSLERQIREGLVPVAAAAPGAETTAAAPPKKIELGRAVPEDIRAIVRDWPVILGKSDGWLKGMLCKAELSMGEDDRLLICFPNAFAANAINETMLDALRQLLNEHSGKEIPFELREFDHKQEFDTQFADLKEILHFDYDVEDE